MKLKYLTKKCGRMIEGLSKLYIILKISLNILVVPLFPKFKYGTVIAQLHSSIRLYSLHTDIISRSQFSHNWVFIDEEPGFIELLHNFLRIVRSINLFVQMLLSSFLHSLLESLSGSLKSIVRYLCKEQMIHDYRVGDDMVVTRSY